MEASFSTELSIERAFFLSTFHCSLPRSLFLSLFFFWFVVVVTDLYKAAFHVEVFLCGMRGGRSGCCSAYSCVCVCVYVHLPQRKWGKRGKKHLLSFHFSLSRFVNGEENERRSKESRGNTLLNSKKKKKKKHWRLKRRTERNFKGTFNELPMPSRTVWRGLSKAEHKQRCLFFFFQCRSPLFSFFFLFLFLNVFCVDACLHLQSGQSTSVAMNVIFFFFRRRSRLAARTRREKGLITGDVAMPR